MTAETELAVEHYTKVLDFIDPHEDTAANDVIVQNDIPLAGERHDKAFFSVQIEIIRFAPRAKFTKVGLEDHAVA